VSEDPGAELLQIAESLERAARRLRRLAGKNEGGPSRRPRLDVYTIKAEIERLGRDAAGQRLSEMSQQQLGELLISLGGTGQDRKRPKDWLIARILWHMFDFEAGHELIRGR
jgi:hypothetical protein